MVKVTVTQVHHRQRSELERSAAGHLRTAGCDAAFEARDGLGPLVAMA